MNVVESYVLLSYTFTYTLQLQPLCFHYPFWQQHSTKSYKYLHNLFLFRLNFISSSFFAFIRFVIFPNTTKLLFLCYETIPQLIELLISSHDKLLYKCCQFITLKCDGVAYDTDPTASSHDCIT